jgi:hypothetical protein
VSLRPLSLVASRFHGVASPNQWRCDKAATTLNAERRQREADAEMNGMEEPDEEAAASAPGTYQ